MALGFLTPWLLGASEQRKYVLRTASSREVWRWTGGEEGGRRPQILCRALPSRGSSLFPTLSFPVLAPKSVVAPPAERFGLDSWKFQLSWALAKLFLARPVSEEA